MPLLATQLLRRFPYSRHASAAVLSRGRAYHRNGRVREISLEDDQTAICQVSGDTGEYEVEIQADAVPGGLSFDCDCPHAADGNFCKHMYAAALALTDFLDEDGFDELDFDEDAGFFIPDQAWTYTRLPPAPPKAPARRNWQQQLAQVLAPESSRLSAARGSRYVGLAILERADYFTYGYGSSMAGGETYKLTPYTIPASAWPELTTGDADLGPQAVNALLETKRKWIQHGHSLTRAANPAGCLNLDPDAVALLNVIVNSQNPYYGQGLDTLPMLLRLLSKFDLPVFLGNTHRHKIEQRLRIWPHPVAVTVDLRRSKAGLSLLPGIDRAGEFVPITSRPTVIARRPPWATLGDVVTQLRDPEALGLLEALPLDIPAAGVESFREQYFAALAQQLPLRDGAVQWQEVQAAPIPRLYLRDDKTSRLCAELRFGYGGHEVLPQKTVPPFTVATIPDTWDLVRIHRQSEAEADRLLSLAGPTYGLKRGEIRQPYGTFALRARVHPFDFLLHLVPRLAAAGFEIYGEERLKLGKINRNTPSLRVSITSGLDWFDLKTVVEFGDQQISLHEVRKALQRGERFVKLADGSAGQIPEAWLNQYRHLWKLADETPDGFRVRDAHLALLDPLLEAAPEIKLPPDWQERRNRLRSFERITPQPVAENFSGELRPYQRHGVDWLQFLHDFRFGGILADDMGLGKTIQVLAFLQLLKERAPRRGAAASLLVVPKSLIANWQREAERFAPALRCLPYLGQVRRKDTASFKGWDIVLTTYGTLLRDIGSLRRYRFHYVILDESQAIKNPISKSAKAARLLEAEHRLALTGTPVENNTLELWSQFAYLNPGLLGSLDFFRREFANPIESQGDEAAAATLRRLVYPFILRRTKAQVAPELPPRAERILYTDLAPAQAKLYALTRDRYRAELLGLIENQGLNDARFKILEGLLRLRQIALHPRLVEGSYRGGAPKLEILLETLETLRSENHKVLVFSQFVSMLKLVKRELDARRLKYVYLDGQTAKRQARVDLFQSDPAYPFFLISLKAGGVGLNLTAADYVVHLDPWWNPAVEMQASDRAHRIGQDKPVFIYKLIARNTVEEKILQLQEKKRALVNSLVTTEASFFKSLTQAEVSQLFE